MEDASYLFILGVKLKIFLAELGGFLKEALFFEEKDEAESVGAVIGLEREGMAERGEGTFGIAVEVEGHTESVVELAGVGEEFCVALEQGEFFSAELGGALSELGGLRGVAIASSICEIIEQSREIGAGASGLGIGLDGEFVGVDGGGEEAESFVEETDTEQGHGLIVIGAEGSSEGGEGEIAVGGVDGSESGRVET